MRSWTELSQFVKIFLPTFASKTRAAEDKEARNASTTLQGSGVD